MKKSLYTLVLGLLVLALLPLPVLNSTARAQEKVTLRVTNWAGVEEAAEFQKIVDAVNAASDTFEIVYEPKPADYYTQLQTALAGETAPDLFWLDQDLSLVRSQCLARIEVGSSPQAITNVLSSSSAAQDCEWTGRWLTFDSPCYPWECGYRFERFRQYWEECCPYGIPGCSRFYLLWQGCISGCY